MTSEIHRVKNAISPIFCTKTTEWCVKGKNPLGLIPYKDGFSYDDNVCWQGVEERFLFYYFQDWVVYVEFRVYFLQAASVDTIYIRGRCPRLLMVVPSRHRSACGYGCWRRLIRGRTETSRGQEGLSLFIALRWMQEPGGVMVWLAENIQACLRIFWQLQHQWLARDILHQAQGVFIVFVLCPTEGTEVRLISWHIACILHPFTYYLNFPSAPRIAQNPPRSTSLEFEWCRK